MRRLLDSVKNFRLEWRLFWDGRVPLLLKLAMPVSLSYLAWPLDLIRDFSGVPLVGRVDDFIILALASIIFVRLAPPQIVREHRNATWAASLTEGGKLSMSTGLR